MSQWLGVEKPFMLTYYQDQTSCLYPLNAVAGRQSLLKQKNVCFLSFMLIPVQYSEMAEPVHSNTCDRLCKQAGASHMSFLLIFHNVHLLLQSPVSRLLCIPALPPF